MKPVLGSGWGHVTCRVCLCDLCPQCEPPMRSALSPGVWNVHLCALLQEPSWDTRRPRGVSTPATAAPPPPGSRLRGTSAGCSPVLGRRIRSSTALPPGRTCRGWSRWSNRAVGWMMSTVTTGVPHKCCHSLGLILWWPVEDGDRRHPCFVLQG